MRILLVEDEEHKVQDLTNRLQIAGIDISRLTEAGSVRDAVLLVFDNEYDLVILDMALPTFTKEKLNRESGGVAQAAGGVEVLRAMKETGRRSKVIVVTQYPDISISGERVRLARIKQTLKKRYDQDVVGAVLYSYKTAEWIAHFDKCLDEVK